MSYSKEYRIKWSKMENESLQWQSLQDELFLLVYVTENVLWCIHKFWENLLFNLEIEPRTSVLLTNANVMKQRCTNHYNQWIHLLLKLLQLTKWNRENIMRWASNPRLHEYKFNMLSWTISRLTIAEPGHSINIQNIEQNRKKFSW